jgi:hypothetical protein
MTIFLDRHNVGEASAQDVADLHVRDLAVQDRYGKKLLAYWFDSVRGTAFCLLDAPDKDMADKVHAEAHGHTANEMITVSASAVEAFLGRVQDPRAMVPKPISEPAFRAIMFTDMALLVRGLRAAGLPLPVAEFGAV